MKHKYQAPKIVDEQPCEAQAIGCPKMPGLGDPNFCAEVWSGDKGTATSGCFMDPETRSS